MIDQTYSSTCEGEPSAMDHTQLELSTHDTRPTTHTIGSHHSKTHGWRRQERTEEVEAAAQRHSTNIRTLRCARGGGGGRRSVRFLTLPASRSLTGSRIHQPAAVTPNALPPRVRVSLPQAERGGTPASTHASQSPHPSPEDCE